MRLSTSLAYLAAATILTPPALAAAPASRSVPIPSLVRQVTIPHSMFKLANGLTVIVHEDHKAPIVAVSVWYNVGSKDEPARQDRLRASVRASDVQRHRECAGRLFRHYLQQIGATDYNGTTWFDRTNYFETVPAGALDRALFMESDRMGHLLGAVTQGVLDNQRGVVQNEKRQGDNQPGGLVQYAAVRRPVPAPAIPITTRRSARWPTSTPRASPTSSNGSVDHYGPNNAVLVLAGDVTRGAGAAAGREIFRRHPARAGQQSGDGRRADAGHGQDDRR